MLLTLAVCRHVILLALYGPFCVLLLFITISITISVEQIIKNNSTRTTIPDTAPAKCAVGTVITMDVNGVVS